MTTLNTKKTAESSEISSVPLLSLSVELSTEGIDFMPSTHCPDWIFTPLSFGRQSGLAAFLAQLADEGFADFLDDMLHLPWEAVYQLLESEAYRDSFPLLGLPPLEQWRPVLSSQGSLSDSNFSILLAGWVDPDGNQPSGNVVINGAAIIAGQRKSLLPEKAWQTFRAIVAFHKRPTNERDLDSNQRGWSSIRRHAIASNANLNDFLKKTVVLTPERLKIKLRKSKFESEKVLEVIPGFGGEPNRWLEIFDRFQDVQDHYEVPDGDGLTHILITPEAKSVLFEIKRMPGRRVAGERAEAFVRNPFATLGPDAEKVIDPQEFDQAREDAGISFARFTARVSRDDWGMPTRVALLIEEAIQGDIRSEKLPFETPEVLERFISKLEERINKGTPCCFWEGYDLEILGDTSDQLCLLKEALSDWRRPMGYSAAEIFDLSRYSDRVEGFRVEKPYYSLFIARKNDQGMWIPDNIDGYGVFYTPEGSNEPIFLPLNPERLNQLKEALRKAKEEKQDSFPFPPCPKPMKASEAEDILSVYPKAQKDISEGKFDPNKHKNSHKPAAIVPVVKPNVSKVDHEERRGDLFMPPGAKAKLPKSLKKDVKLLPHQEEGVAWLQHLWSKSPDECRGAMLADDMGLGKTLQLLAFISRCLEDNPESEPFLIVAPVSLLENWQEEIKKFFVPGAIPALPLYGASIYEKILPQDAMDKELVEKNIRLLKRDWLGNAKVVLTTYETLRSWEFSLAMMKWSAIICDEAQKIKNPTAMVTRAAKKQNARFKIASTGTPVENTLADLWSLFDFIQPGLLGALNNFGSRYRKPIEAEAEEDKKRVNELRELIEPQIKRRMKDEVAKDLPKKISDHECRNLPISQLQRAYYANAVSQFRSRASESAASARNCHLRLLLYLRRLCSDPRLPGQIATDSEPLTEIEKRSPKLAWLSREMNRIKAKGEKVIVFCEIRDLQRMLQLFIAERFGLTAYIINGDTPTGSQKLDNRQKRIMAFHNKPGFGAIILSPLAAGFGLNIQAANHVIHFMRAWNPAKEDQATDRAYRIGQTKDVYVYCPVVAADDFITFDAKLDKLLEWKRGLARDMLNGAGDLNPADFVGDLEDVDGGSMFGNGALTAASVASMDSESFEVFCAALWSKHGYTKTYRTPKCGDGGIDVIAIKGESGALIQCKTSARDGQELGWEAVKDVTAGAAAYAERHTGIKFKKIAVTNQRFNQTALVQANLNHVELVDRMGIEKMLAEKPITRAEFEKFLFLT